MPLLGYSLVKIVPFTLVSILLSNLRMTFSSPPGEGLGAVKVHHGKNILKTKCFCDFLLLPALCLGVMRKLFLFIKEALFNYSTGLCIACSLQWL